MKAITLRYINNEEKQTNFYLWIRDIFKQTVIIIPQKNSGEYGHFFQQTQTNKQQQQKPACKIA